MKNDQAKKSVIRVGAGRGFVVQDLSTKTEANPSDRYVITAAHCLPHLPAWSSSGFEQRTYPDLLGTLSETPVVFAECIFVDPIADIAVLGEPHIQALPDEWEAYTTWLEDFVPIAVSDSYPETKARILSLGGKWTECEATTASFDGSFWISGAQCIEGGMSGSPILAEDGSAIGVVALRLPDSDVGRSREGGPNPRLARDLPRWLWHRFTRGGEGAP